MVRYLGPVCRLCRRESTKLFLKGSKCYSVKCPVSKRPFPPGQRHHSTSSSSRDYLMQLREKQKCARYYNVVAAKFSSYFKRAHKLTGLTSDNFFKILESRLDSILSNGCFVYSRLHGRQLIIHKYVTVNDHIVDIPSYEVKVGDVIKIREDKKHTNMVSLVREYLSLLDKDSKNNCDWLEIDKENLSIKIIKPIDPKTFKGGIKFNRELIVDFYSK